MSFRANTLSLRLLRLFYHIFHGLRYYAISIICYSHFFPALGLRIATPLEKMKEMKRFASNPREHMTLLKRSGKNIILISSPTFGPSIAITLLY